MANGTNNGVEAVTAAGKPGGRGPSYPALTIEQAIVKAQQFWSAEKRSAAPMVAAVKHWGYSETSSSGKMAAAALLQYGLLQDEGAKESRTVKLTGRALDILLDADGSPKRLAAVQDAVLAPTLYADLLTKWQGHELPSDQTLRYYLLREKSFNESSVDGFIKDFRASLTYAKLDKPTTIPQAETLPIEPPPAAASSVDKLPPEIGDLVQWEASGVLRLEAPRRVRAKQEHDGAWWVFVEGSETGIPMEEVLVMERKLSEAGKSPPPSLPLAPAVTPALPVTAGEQQVASGKLGKALSYRLLTTGDVGAKELGKIIKHLETHKALLDDDDDGNLH